MRSHLDNARPLPDLLRHLAGSTLVPEPRARKELLTAADALERTMPDNPARVVNHGGGGVDPVLQAIEGIEADADQLARRCYELIEEVRSLRADLQRSTGTGT